MSDFDVAGAKAAGYSDTEIADHLAKQNNFDVGGARKAGYSDAEILSHLTGKAAATTSPGTSAARIVGQGAIGVNDAIAGTVGAPVDAAAWALRQAGLPINNPVGGSESIKKGIDYVATLPGRAVDAVQRGSVAPFTEDRTSRFEPATPVEKTARGVGEGVGNAMSIALPAGAIGRTAQGLTGGIARTLGTAAPTQAISGAVGGGVGAATDNPYLGMAAGAAVPLGAAGARGAISPVRNRLTAQEQNLVGAADREGIPLTPAQRTGSPTLRTVEGTMNSLPLTSGPMQQTFQNQREQFNRANLERAGVTATDASPATLDHAFTQQGRTFDGLAARTTVRPDAQFANDIAQVEQNYGRRLATDVKPVFTSYMEDLEPVLQAARRGQNVQFAGDVYASTRSDLTKRIRESQNNPALQRALGGIVDALDNVMERSTSGPLRQEWQDARREYQALKTIDKSMQGGTQADRATGNIPFSGLKGSVAQSDRAGFSRGRGQLNELARVGDFLAGKVPDSGTVPRGMVANALTGGALFGGGFAAGGLPGAAGATITPYIASRLYNSRLGQAYLSNQVAGQTPLVPLYASQAVNALVHPQTVLGRKGDYTFSTSGPTVEP